MKLKLGANDRHIEGFISVDIVPPADQIVDLEGVWSWENSSVSEVMALDVCEHIKGHYWESIGSAPRFTDGRIWFMNELHRVLKPGARATIETPNAAKGSGFIQDPTHVSPYCLSTFKYFEHGAFAHSRLAKSYGITAAFKVISLEEFETSGEDARETVWKIKAVLEAVK